MIIRQVSLGERSHSQSDVLTVIIFIQGLFGEMGIFSFLSTPPVEAKIILDGEDERPQYRRTLIPDSPNKIGTHEMCPVFHEGDRISGKIILVNRGKKGNVDHNGVVLRLVGVIQVEGRDGQDDFLDSSLKLLPATNGEALIPDHPIELGFSFGALGLPFDSYEGQRVMVRYYLELQMKRSFSDVHKERTLWVIGHQQHSKLPNDSSPNPISMEIGLTVFLHIQINLTRTVLPKDGIVEGSVLFLLVGTEIREARLQLIRREILVSEEQEAVSLGPKEGQILGSHQIMHGLAQRGDRIPFRFLLATTDVGPTKVAVGGVFSIRYYLMVTFHDQEDRKYFKSQEIMINKETTAKIIA